MCIPVAHLKVGQLPGFVIYTTTVGLCLLKIFEVFVFFLLAVMESANSSALWASLPKRVRLGLGDDTGAPPPCEVLADLFADESDLRLCLCQLGVEEPVPCEMVQALLLLQQQAINPSARRQKRRASMFPEQQALAIQSKCARGAQPLVIPDRVWLLKSSGAIRRGLTKCRPGTQKALLPRAEQEKKELMRWRASLSDFLRELGMPVVQQVLLSSNPDNALANALGTVRSATLRKHFREARRIKAYSKATSDSNWPQHVGVILSYLEERRCEPCGPSVPGAILQSLAFIEKVGGVAVSDRLSGLPVVRNTVNQLTMDLQHGAPPKHQAPALPLAIVAALEITVCDAAAGQYTRGFAFYKLLKLWAAGRHSDFEGLNPSSLFLSVAGLEGRLDRTKTSGPGRRVRFLPLFVSRRAYLVKPDWLEIGFQLWLLTEIIFCLFQQATGRLAGRPWHLIIRS